MIIKVLIQNLTADAMQAYLAAGTLESNQITIDTSTDKWKSLPAARLIKTVATIPATAAPATAAPKERSGTRGGCGGCGRKAKTPQT